MTQKKQDLKANNFAEAQLQLSWNRLKTHQQLPIDGKDEWIMLSPGTWNLEAGPDFLNAKFAKNGEIISGDVEIHKKTSDWAVHGHHRDENYHNVILHVVTDDDASACSSEISARLPDIPVMRLTPRSRTARLAAADKFPRGKCENIFVHLDDQQLVHLFRHAGVKRFNERVDSMLEEMGSIGVNSTFLKRIFDACGYKKNRTQFSELFRRFTQYNDLNSAETEAVLWGESGLLPDPSTVRLDKEMNDFVCRLWEIWWRIRQSAAEPITWVRSGIRPMNSPERRVAALNVLIKQLGSEPLRNFAKFAKASPGPKEFLKKLNHTMRCNHPLWDKYHSFSTKTAQTSAVLGSSRTADICVNTVLPALKAYAILTDDSDTGRFVERVYRSLPRTQTNRILETAALKWFMPPARQKNIFTDAVSQQGAIHIFRNFCEETCLECDICPLGELMGKANA